MTVRLPTVGGAPDPVFQEAIPGAAPEPWGDGSRPLLCVASVAEALPVLPLARDLVRAVAHAGLRTAALRTRRRRGPVHVEAHGASMPDGRALAEAGAAPVVVVHTDATHAARAVRDGLVALEQGDGPVVCVGNDVPALRHAALTILLTGLHPRSAWAPSARALSDLGAVDLELPESRPGLAEELVRAWLATVATVRSTP